MLSLISSACCFTDSSVLKSSIVTRCASICDVRLSTVSCSCSYSLRASEYGISSGPMRGGGGGGCGEVEHSKQLVPFNDNNNNNIQIVYFSYYNFICKISYTSIF